MIETVVDNHVPFDENKKQRQKNHYGGIIEFTSTNI